MTEPKSQMNDREQDEPFAPPHGAPTVHSQYVKPTNFRELETELSNISERLAVFDTNLRASAESEKDFCTFVQTFTNSMDTFILQHIEEDRKLTRLIAEDTQRAQDAKREYDTLASRFDDDVRPPNPTKIREFLSTMSTYIGIVLSLIFMAPLHAVWSTIIKLLTSLGLVSRTAEVRNRRDGRGTPEATRRQIKSPRQERRPHAQFRQQRNDLQRRTTQSQPSSQRLPRRLRDGKHKLSPKSASSERRSLRTRTKTASTTSTGRNEGISSAANINEALNIRRQRNASNKDEKEVFVDARDKNETPDVSLRHLSNQEIGDDMDSYVDDNDSSRPCWAVPNGESGTFRDDSTFPSADFWNISTDDIRLEMLKDSASQGGPSTGHLSNRQPSST